MAGSLEPGQAILLRSVYRDRVRWAVPHRSVAHDGDRLVRFRAPGAQGKWMWRDPDGRYLPRWVGTGDPRDLTWSRTNVLQLVRPGDSHTVEVFWDEAWYVNLRAGRSSASTRRWEPLLLPAGRASAGRRGAGEPGA